MEVGSWAWMLWHMDANMAWAWMLWQTAGGRDPDSLRVTEAFTSGMLESLMPTFLSGLCMRSLVGSRDHGDALKLQRPRENLPPASP